MAHPVHKDSRNLSLGALLNCSVIMGTSHGMLHNPGGSGGVLLRNNGENRLFRKVVYMFHIPPAKWCVCDIYHLRQHRENDTTSVYVTIFMQLTAQKGKGDRGKRTSDCARTQDLHSITEFQPGEPWRPVEILVPHCSYVPVTGVPLSSDTLRPATQVWYCVLCDGSRLSGA